VLALKRRGVADIAWQMPQGGSDATETPREAVLREETGLRPADVELLAQYPDWLVHERPIEYRKPKVGWGQANKWFPLRARPDAIVQPDGQAFDDDAWLKPADRLLRVVAFRRPVHDRVLAYLMGAQRAERGR
jgi:putative (di)nucleoside polyphosphate hydrolase